MRDGIITCNLYSGFEMKPDLHYVPLPSFVKDESRYLLLSRGVTHISWIMIKKRCENLKNSL